MKLQKTPMNFFKRLFSSTTQRPVLLVTRGLYCGGVERTCLSLLEGLTDSGCRTFLGLLESVTELNPPGELEHRILKPGGSWLERKLLKPFVDPLRVFLRYLRYSLILQWWILRVRPRVVVTTCMQSMIAGRFVFKLGARWIGSVGSDVSAGLQRDLPKVRRPIQATIRWVYKKPDLMVTPSYGLKTVLGSEFRLQAQSIEVIPNPVSVEAIRHQAQEKCDEEGFLLGVGRLIPVKGFDLLIRALRQLPDTHLILLGDGPEKPHLQRLAKELGVGDRVAMPGPQANPWKFMRQASVVVIPSLSEGFSNVLVEALSVGARVLVSDCPHGPREIVNSPDVAKTFPVGDVSALASSLKEILDNQDPGEGENEAARHRALDYDTSTLVPQYQKVFDDLVSPRFQAMGLDELSCNFWTELLWLAWPLREAFGETKGRKIRSSKQLRHWVKSTASARREPVTAPEIDLVVAWVDGKDPAHRALRDSYALSERGYCQDAATPCRMRDNQELKFLLRSVFEYAPWVRRIHIVVSDHQRPDWLADHPKIQLVNDTEIFENPDHLPTFNSHALECNIHRIPGLAEHYLYLCDDMMFGAPVSTEDFWDRENGILKLYLQNSVSAVLPVDLEASAYANAWRNNNKLLDSAFRAERRPTPAHLPTILSRSLASQTEGQFPEQFQQTMSQRFRSLTDIHPVGLQQYVALYTGQAKALPVSHHFIKLDESRPVLRCALRGALKERPKMLCLNDGDLPPDSENYRDLAAFFQAYYPHESEFER